MAKCSYCNSTIVIGGVRDGEHRFCNQTCQQSGLLLSAGKLVSEEDVQKRVNAIHQGSCPRCHGAGPIDIHTSHSVWSALVVTSWKSTPQMSCTPCGKKAKTLSAVGAIFLGWWGFPWGLIITPIQITRNLAGLASSRSGTKPSEQLEKIARLSLAAEMQEAEHRGMIPPPLRKL